MNRNEFIKSAAIAPFLWNMDWNSQPTKSFVLSEGSFGLVGNQVRFRNPYFKQTCKVLFLSDTHLFHSDDREKPYQEYSERMSKAYNKTKHFQTGAATHPQEAFENTLDYAVKQACDFVILGGDIFSYPSEAAIEWVLAKLDERHLPYAYIAGNHDWHYEGMPGKIVDLRKSWLERRLKPLFQGENPLMYYRDVKGIRFMFLDDSTNEILPEQLKFFQKHIQTKLPVVLNLHIPLYVPGADIHFGCGHPQWGAATDPSYVPERRPRWPESGHTSTTFAFHKAVFQASNIIAIFAGHTHEQSLHVYNQIPQFVTRDNAHAAYFDIQFLSE
jgi:hypothetical protein